MFVALPRHHRAVTVVPRLLMLGALCGVILPAAARAEDRSATRTKAYLSTMLAAKTGLSGGQRAFRQALSDASANAVTVPETTPITVTVALNPRNADDLDRAVTEITTPGNSNYGRFLTPAEFLAAYAPTEQQVQAVVTHLLQSGFTGIEVAPNRMLITATGRPAAIQTAFHTGMVQFTLDNRQVIANGADVTVPSELGSIVGGVLGLQTASRPRTQFRVQSDTTTAGRQSGPGPAPGPGSGSGTKTSTVAHNPTDFPKIYDVGSTVTGSSTKVGIISWGSLTNVQTDLKTFASRNGLAAVSSSVVNTGSGSYVADSSSDVEWDLDSQTIVGTSGGVSQLIFYAAPNGGSGVTDAGITAAYNRAVSDDTVKIINVSLGEDEDSAEADGTQAADDKIFKVAQLQGQTFSVSSGDAGAYEATDGVITNARGVLDVSLSSYSVSEPATSPSVIAVGGTTLSTSGTTTYASEVTWNEGLAYADAYDDTIRIWATGGGTSDYEAAPAWQTSALGSSVTKRVLPDVAFDAASASGATIIVHGTSEQVGGTSLASPIFVGIWARMESANNNALGFPAASFYKYLPSNTALRHDIVSGNNGYNGYGLTAGTGYDLVTGFGSLDIAKLSAFITATSDFAR